MPLKYCQKKIKKLMLSHCRRIYYFVYINTTENYFNRDTTTCATIKTNPFRYNLNNYIRVFFWGGREVAKVPLYTTRWHHPAAYLHLPSKWLRVFKNNIPNVQNYTRLTFFHCRESFGANRGKKTKKLNKIIKHCTRHRVDSKPSRSTLEIEKKINIITRRSRN